MPSPPKNKRKSITVDDLEDQFSLADHSGDNFSLVGPATHEAYAPGAQQQQHNNNEDDDDFREEFREEFATTSRVRSAMDLTRKLSSKKKLSMTPPRRRTSRRDSSTRRTNSNSSSQQQQQQQQQESSDTRPGETMRKVRRTPSTMMMQNDEQGNGTNKPKTDSYFMGVGAFNVKEGSLEDLSLSTPSVMGPPSMNEHGQPMVQVSATLVEKPPTREPRAELVNQDLEHGYHYPHYHQQQQYQQHFDPYARTFPSPPPSSHNSPPAAPIVEAKPIKKRNWWCIWLFVLALLLLVVAVVSLSVFAIQSNQGKGASTTSIVGSGNNDDGNNGVTDDDVGGDPLDVVVGDDDDDDGDGSLAGKENDDNVDGTTNAPSSAPVVTPVDQTPAPVAPGQTAVPTSIGQTALPTPISQTAVPTSIGQTAVPTSIGQTAVPTSRTTPSPTSQVGSNSTPAPTSAPVVGGGSDTPAPTNQAIGGASTPGPTSEGPTVAPTPPAPTPSPTTAAPTKVNSPTMWPTVATVSPTPAPTTVAPTPAPTPVATTPSPTTKSPTDAPTPDPTNAAATPNPTTASPTPAPTTAAPTPAPTLATTPSPTPTPTSAPVPGGNTGGTDLSAYRWTQVGQDLTKAAAADFGSALSLSANGQVLAVGSPDNGMMDVYELQSDSTWTVRSNIVARGTRTDFGTTVQLSFDGGRMATANPYLSDVKPGVGRVMNWREGTYRQLGGAGDENRIHGEVVAEDGTVLVPESPTNEFGYDVAMTPDGSTMAIGARRTCLVRVVRILGRQWQDMPPIGCYDDSDFSFGWSVALDSAGTTLVVGSPEPGDFNYGGAAGNLTPAGKGRAHVFRLSGNQWEPLGNLPLVGQDVNDRFGWTVSVSDNGRVVAMGAPGADSESGSVHVYQWSDSKSDWEDKGSSIPGNTFGGHMGMTVSLSPDGETIAVGTGREAKTYRFVAGSWRQMGETLSSPHSVTTDKGVVVDLLEGRLVVGFPSQTATADGVVRAYNLSHEDEV